jgi:hypothetical protein
MPHAAGDGARRMDYALDIDPAHARNRLGVVFVERAAPRHAGIVYEDRERAELLFRGRDHRCDRRGVGDVCRRGNGAAAGA